MSREVNRWRHAPLCRAAVAASEARRIALASMRDCRANAVDWRSRCLAAERERDEAVARAERAEAECGAMRAVVEAVEAESNAWNEREEMERRGFPSLERDNAVARAANAIDTALDEWRRTRQGKEAK